MRNSFISRIFVAAAVVVLAGCAATGGGVQQQGQYPQQNQYPQQQIQSDAGVVTQERSQRDGSAIINMTPGRMVADGSANLSNTRLGALWTGTTPDSVAIILMNPALGGPIQNVDITIDGNATRWTPRSLTGPETGGYDQPSSSAVIVPYAMVQRMTSGRKVRVRVQGQRGYEDAVFSIQRASNGSPMSVTAFYDFMGRVDGLRRMRR